MGRRTLAIAAALVLATPVAAHAASKAKPPAKKAQGEAKADNDEKKEKEEENDGRRWPTRVTKLRQGSVLRRNKPLDQGVDLRGELERRRDLEIIQHYTRVAELDVIEAVARKEKDPKLVERVENVRRKETRRFWAVMQHLRQLARLRSASGAP